MEEEQPEKPKAGRPPVNKMVELRKQFHIMGLELRYDQFRREHQFRRPGQGWSLMSDSLEYTILTELAGRCVTVPENLIHATLVVEAEKNGFHPVLEYLDGLVWDGEPRLDTWLVRYCHVEDTPFVRKAGSAFMIAAVRRIKQPGCKFDECLLLVSDEGSGKSSMIRALVRVQNWVTESLNISASPKQVIEGTKGVWLVEAAEMTGAKEIEKTKAFLSRQVDGPVREAYARNVTDVPRQFVVFATTNQPKPLANETGARRFWPVKTGTIDTDGIARDRDQLWAEAVRRDLYEEEIHITAKHYSEATEAQNKFASADPWRETIEEMIAARPQKRYVPVAAVWEVLGLDTSKRTREQSMRINDIMKKLWYRREEQSKYVKEEGRMMKVYGMIMPWDKDGTVTGKSAEPELEPDDWFASEDPSLKANYETDEERVERHIEENGGREEEVESD